MQREARIAARQTIMELRFTDKAILTTEEVELKGDRKASRFLALVRTKNPGGGWGGFKTGYGSWILRPGYQSTGDWNDKSSPCHY